MSTRVSDSGFYPEEITQELEQAGFHLSVDLRGDELLITGEVESEADHQGALDLVRAFADPRGLFVSDSIEVIEEVPEQAFGGGVTEEDQDVLSEGLEPLDIEYSPGTVDSQESAEEAMPYFPPTDPVEERILEGGDRLDITRFEPDVLNRSSGQPGDAEISSRVRQALREDASTSDFDIHVETRSGVVYLRGAVETLDDAEKVEAVASNIAGVKDVREELEVISLMHPPDE